MTRPDCPRLHRDYAADGLPRWGFTCAPDPAQRIRTENDDCSFTDEQTCRRCGGQWTEHVTARERIGYLERGAESGRRYYEQYREYRDRLGPLHVENAELRAELDGAHAHIQFIEANYEVAERHRYGRMEGAA